MSKGSGLRRLVDDILKKKDPSGYYVIPARRGALEVIPGELAERLVVEEASELIVLRTRSRSVARRVAVLLARRGLVIDPTEA